MSNELHAIFPPSMAFAEPMPEDLASRTQHLLERYYADSQSNAVALDELFSLLRPHLSRFFRERGEKEEVEELTSETTERLIRAIRTSTTSDGSRIHDLTGYARAVAQNVFNDRVRRQRPLWHRLKRRIRYVMEGRAGGDLFACWQQGPDLLAGFSEWQGRTIRPTAQHRAAVSDLNEFEHRVLAGRDPGQIPLPELLAHLLRWLNTPVRIDELTNIVASVLRLQDVETISFETYVEENGPDISRTLSDRAGDAAQAVLENLAQEALSVVIWQEVQALPARQCAALLLGLQRDELVLLAGHMSAIAEALSVDPEEMMAIWNRLPLPDREIAARLGATPLQVSNLRKCARERLSRRLSREIGSPS